MKKIAKYLLILSAVAVSFSACKKEVEPFLPGEAEVENCYGVYFPSQEASGSHIYNPTQDKVMEITVARTNTKGAIEVPVVASFSEEGIFHSTDVKFADGQSETSFKVFFDKAKEGVTYDAHFLIEDAAYASKYNAGAIGLDFSVMCVEMKDFMTEDGSKKAMLTFSDNVFWGEVHDDVYLQYYEVDGIRYCSTTGGKLVSPADGSDGIGPWGTDVQLNFKWYTNVKMTIDEVDYDFIEVLPQYHGWDNTTRNSEVWFADYYNYYQSNASTPYNGDAIKFFTNNGADYPPCYYDGHGGFIFNLAYYMPTSGGYWYGFKLNAPVAIAEGYLRVDYSLEAETDYSDGGETPVFLTAGADVTSVKYEIYEGTLNAVQIEAKIAEIDADKKAKTIKEEELVLDEETAKRYATLSLAPEASGIYTFVGLAYSKDGKLQNSASVAFKHVAAGEVEEYAVDVTCFTEATPERYLTLNDYDSFAYGIYGTDLTDVHVGVFSAATVEKNGINVVLNVLKADAEGKYAVAEDVLAQINQDGGYYTVATKLAANTLYYVFVWATNGSMEKFVYDDWQTERLPYVWNELGKGTLTDGLLLPLFGMEDVTVACDVYAEQNTPGLYKVTGFQLELAAAFYEEDPAKLIPYEGPDGNWWNAEIIVDATDPEKVYIGEQDYGIYVSETYGYVLIDSEHSGTLKDGVITFPAKEMYVGMTGNGKWYYGNSNGTFKITLPAASNAPALTAAATGNAPRTNYVLARDARVWNKPVQVYERDPKPAQNVASQVIGHERHQRSNARVETKAPAVVF